VLAAPRVLKFLIINKTMAKKGIITLLMLMVSMIASAQLWVGYKSDSVKIAEYREKIALDYSMPDYSVTSIDEKKIS
jgi:maltodextrin utilization protein YvdJ